MNLEAVLAFCETAVVDLEAAMANPTLMAAYSAKLASFVATVKELLGSGVAKYLVSHFTSEADKLKADFTAAVAKLHGTK